MVFYRVAFPPLLVLRCTLYIQYSLRAYTDIVVAYSVPVHARIAACGRFFVFFRQVVMQCVLFVCIN